MHASSRIRIVATVIAASIICAFLANASGSSRSPDAREHLRRVCPRGAVYLCDRYVPPPYTVVYDRGRILINSVVYEDMAAIEADVSRRMHDNTYSAQDLAFYLQRLAIQLRNNGLGVRDVSGLVAAKAESLAGESISIKERGPISFLLCDRAVPGGVGVIVPDDEQLKRENEAPPPGYLAFAELVDALEAGRPVFSFEHGRHGPMSQSRNDSTAVALWHGARTRKSGQEGQELEAKARAYRSRGQYELWDFCNDLLYCHGSQGTLK